MLTVKKRSGQVTDFNFGKIEKAIRNAFADPTVRVKDRDNCDKVVDHVRCWFNAYEGEQPIDVESIQNLVEDVIMNFGECDVARCYILYRDAHKRTREIVDKHIAFIEKYKQESTVADATVDDNANVRSRSVANMNAEIKKQENILVNRGIVMDKLRELFPDFDAKQYARDLENRIIYKHDESTSNSGPTLPYTYSSKEVVEVLYNSKTLLLPLDLLYSIVDEPEILVDKENEVYQKIPWNLYVKDYENKYTQVTHLTKKKRHRDLYRIKTAFGEDIVVTDNHPLIVDKDDINNTIQAVDSLNQKQFRIGYKLSFKGKDTLDLATILPTYVTVEEKFIKYQQSCLKRIIKLNEELGYLVGFFIGDGGYNNTSKTISIAQKTRGILDVMNGYLFECFGISGTVRKDSSSGEKWCLEISNRYVYELFRGYFKIQDKAQNKTIPYNILEFNEKFAKGILEGLIDSDGTIKNEDCCISIRLSSRACVQQITQLFRHFGYSIGNSIQSLPFSNNTSYHTNYTIWGISATKRSDSVDLSLSFKVREKLTTAKLSSFKYKSNGYCTITSVDKIEEESAFLTLNEYIYDITTTSHTFCLNNILVHNCASSSMYPFLLNGIKDLGGLSAAPKNIDSFCGMFCNLVFTEAGQFLGATAFPEALLYFTYFAKKEWGDDFYKTPDKVISVNSEREKTIRIQIHQYWQQIVYTINQNSANRGLQAAFTNFSYFDEPFFHGMFDGFCFPDGTRPDWESLQWVQKEFMQWFNKERLRVMLPFPVETFALIYKDGKFIDEDSYRFVCEELARGHSFFVYISDTVDSLSSCCRLKNKIQTHEFNFTNGMVGLETGSKSVISLNLNHIVQDWYNSLNSIVESSNKSGKPSPAFVGSLLYSDNELRDNFLSYLKEILDRVYKYHTAYNSILHDMYNSDLLPVYKAGFINLDKQYLTIGIVGLSASAEFLGYKINDNILYQKYCQTVFDFIKHQNQLNHTKSETYNTELVPAEACGAKLYNYDKAHNYWVPNDINLYTSYIFRPYDKDLSVLEKIRMHGRDFIGERLDGGSSCHSNLDSHPSYEQYLKIIKYAAEVGCQYLGFNIPNSECKNCGYITKVPITKCPHCGSEKISYWDRIIGYMAKIENWNQARRIEQKTRVYSHITD